jgi:hypothetical protein
MAIHPFNDSVFRGHFSEGDLSISPGDVITKVQKHSDGWWEGTCRETSGFFPSNYVAPNAIGRAKCVHNHYASRLDELNIKKGDELIIYERRSSGWLRVICEGKGGLVPPTHIREIKSTHSTAIPVSTSRGKVPSASASSLPGQTQAGQSQLPKFSPSAMKKAPGPAGPVRTGPPPATAGPPPMPSATGARQAPVQKMPPQMTSPVQKFPPPMATSSVQKMPPPLVATPVQKMPPPLVAAPVRAPVAPPSRSSPPSPCR